MAQTQSLPQTGAGSSRATSWLVLLAAALHLAAGLASGAMWSLLFGVVLALFGAGLMRGMRRLACLTYLTAMAAAIATLGAMGSWVGPIWWLGLVLAADLLAAITLFLHIWRR